MSKIPESCEHINTIFNYLAELYRECPTEEIRKICKLIREEFEIVREINTSLRSRSSVMRTINEDLRRELKKFNE